jgi:hypothetical protein
MRMTAAWHEQANTTMTLAASGRTVHHIPLAYVHSFLCERGNVDVFLFPDWDFELLTMEVGGLAPPLFACVSLSFGRCFGGSQAPREEAAGFWPTAPSRPRGAVTTFSEASGWWTDLFDVTLGFPGEGPAPSPSHKWHYKPFFLPDLAPPSLGSGWMQWARATMVCTIPIHVPSPIIASSSDDYVHLCLLALVEHGNQSTPIAARPSRVAALLGPDDPTSLAALGGSAYNFHTRPFKYSRPRSIILSRSQMETVTTELRRLSGL